MRVVLILLGIVTVALAVVLAREGEWWIAIPDGLFGLGVAFVAWESLREDRRIAAGGAAPPPVTTGGARLR